MLADRVINLYGNYEQKKTYYFYTNLLYNTNITNPQRYVIQRSSKTLLFLMGEYDEKTQRIFCNTKLLLSCSNDKMGHVDLRVDKKYKEIVFANALLLFLKQKESFNTICKNYHELKLHELIEPMPKDQTVNDLQIKGGVSINIQMRNKSFLIFHNCPCFHTIFALVNLIITKVNDEYANELQSLLLGELSCKFRCKSHLIGSQNAILSCITTEQIYLNIKILPNVLCGIIHDYLFNNFRLLQFHNFPPRDNDLEMIIDPVFYDDPLENLKFPHWISKEDVKTQKVSFTVTSQREGQYKTYFYESNQTIRDDFITIFSWLIDIAQIFSFTFNNSARSKWKDLPYELSSFTFGEICLYNILGKYLWQDDLSSLHKIGIKLNGNIFIYCWELIPIDNRVFKKWLMRLPFQKRMDSSYCNVELLDFCKSYARPTNTFPMHEKPFSRNLRKRKITGSTQTFDSIESFWI